MADTKTTSTAPAAAPVATATEANSRDEARNSINLLRYKLNELERDSKRVRPFLSRTQAEAQAKFKAALSSLSEFATFIDQQKTA
jgi:hypothetical protein